MREIHNQLRASATREEILVDAESHFNMAYHGTRDATLDLLPRFKSRKDLADHIKLALRESFFLASINPADGTRNPHSKKKVRAMVACGAADAVRGRVRTFSQIFPPQAKVA